jgi:hypothetical protein
MSTAPKSTTKTTDPDPTSWKAGNEPAKVEFVLVDYQGTVGSAPGQMQVEHKRSPLVCNLFEAGINDMAIQPGLNLLPSKDWEAYSKREPQVKELLARGQLKQLSELPGEEFGLQNLIGRTISRAALDHIESVVRLAPDPERRDTLIKSIHFRRNNTTAIEIVPRPYVPAAGKVESIVTGNDLVAALLRQLSINNAQAPAAG